LGYNHTREVIRRVVFVVYPISIVPQPKGAKVDIQKVLDDTSRSNAREDLAVMAVDVRAIKEELEGELETAVWRHGFFVATGARLRAFYFVLRARTLKHDVEQLQRLYDRIMRVARMTDYAALHDLRLELRALRTAVRPDINLFRTKLPLSVRSRVDDASMHLA
jgi:hypothetical protein